MDEKTVARFWAKVDKANGPVHPLYGQCWLWTSYRNSGGYGRFDYARIRTVAHRVAWEIHAQRSIPAGMFICHRCDNPPCVNPAHLFLGTPHDNSMDAIAKGRLIGPRAPARGAHHGRAKLTDASVAAILRSRMSQTELGRTYGVSQAVISAIIRGIRWKHIPRPSQCDI